MTNEADASAKLAAVGYDGEPLTAGARTLLRGVQRMMRAHALESLAEVTLANGRRADVLAISTKCEFTIVEIKSSIADFRSDLKWPEYAEYCDRFYFAVGADFPLDILPEGTGIIVADAYGAEIVREAPLSSMAAARRKAVTLTFARTAAMRLLAMTDPAAPWS